MSKRKVASDATRRQWLRQAFWHVKEAGKMLDLLTPKDDDGAKLVVAVRALRSIASSDIRGDGARVRGYALGALRKIKVKP